MDRMKSILCSVVLLGIGAPGWAQEPQYLQQENAQLRRRLERLENAIEELKKATLARTGSATTPAATPASPASAGEEAKSLQRENAQLKQRVEKLERALAAADHKEASPPAGTPAPPKQTPSAAMQPAGAPVASKSPTPPAKAQPVAAAVESKSAAPAAKLLPASASAEAKKPTEGPKSALAAGPVTGEKKSVLSSLDIEIYGLVKADASYDTSRTNPGNYVLFVESEATKKNDNEFNLTANQTKLGLRVGGPASETLKTSGLVEVDFYGNYAAENKAKPQMRHAYLTLEWPQAQFSILAGQTSDIISPLVPNTLNYTVLWDAGNIGYRRPQIRATQNIPMGEKAGVKLEAGVARTLGRTDPTGSESGEDAGFPTVQSRVSASFPFLSSKPTTVGISGHYGQEEFDLNAAGRHVSFESWSVNVDVTQPVCSWLTVLGEWFYGRDLDQYFGGIGQGVNTTSLGEIDATGGWIAASLGPWSKWSFNVGAGIDSADADELPPGGRTQNSSLFGNVYYSWNKNAQFGVELSRWNTLYKGRGDADDLRAQTSFLYKF